MDRRTLEDWLARYGRAWETADPEAAAALFTEDATYRETPFDEVMMGRDAIRRYWEEIPDTQRDISFGWEVVATDPVVVRWRAGWVRLRDERRITLDGVFLLEFGEATGLCRTLREWWHMDEAP
ncbi:MAG TPA: nuclear transport factor 2 family protein [Actinomycetota bacterium]|nr:nuclear transport factor 2 family protein [Actinomycetota bacterium]